MKHEFPPQLTPAFEKLPRGLTKSERETFASYVYVNPKDLAYAEWNYKRDDPAKQKALENQIDRNGQIENIHIPLTADGRLEVFNGNHRLRYFLSRNTERVLAYYHGQISAQEAHRRAIETNETVFQDDPSKLALILKNLTSKHGLDDIAQTTGMAEQYINDLMEQANPEWEYNYTAAEPSQEPDQEAQHLSSLVIEVPADVAQQWEELYTQQLKQDIETTREEFLIQLVENYADDNPS